MENKIDIIIDLLTKINNKLDKLVDDESMSEEDEVMDFLNCITKELGLENKVTIQKVKID